MSIAWVAPMLARSCEESPPAGEPDLIRRPGANGDPSRTDGRHPRRRA
jgi:hypothetical protein